jgi:hypothetical protein
MKWLLISLILIVPVQVLAQSEPLGQAEGAAELPVEGLPDAGVEPDVEPEPKADGPASPEPATSAVSAGPTDAETAQANVTKARKLAKVRRFDEAAKMLEDAYLVLEDPEILRILGETWEAAQQKDKALHYYKLYVDDDGVGEMAKKPVQERIAALGEEEGEESNLGAAGLTGWKSQGAVGGKQGGFFLTFGGRFGYNDGGDFDVTREIDGEQANLQGSWDHAGSGGVFEVGTYLVDGLGLGLRIGVDYMSWTNRAKHPVFLTEESKGVRPDAALNLRWHPGLGFHVGATVGADLIVVTDTGRDFCDTVEGTCPDVGTGMQAARVFYGPLLGYRTLLTEEVSIGIDGTFRHLPVYIDAGGTTGDLPGFSDASWMFSMALTLNIDL